MGLMDFMDIDKLEQEVKGGVKVVYDMFYLSFFKLLEGKNREKFLKDISKDQTIQLIEWFEKHAIPFYESIEEYEKCAKLKSSINYLKQIKEI